MNKEHQQMVSLILELKFKSNNLYLQYDSILLALLQKRKRRRRKENFTKLFKE